MALGSKKNSAAGEKADRVFSQFDSMRKNVTRPISCRVPTSEKDRFERLFRTKEGISLAAGIKKALYEYAEKRGWNG